MVASLSLNGLHVPLVTPFTPDDRVDAESLERLARRIAAEGASGLVALGTTGEVATLSTEEKSVVVEVCASVCAETGISLMVGAGSNATDRSAAELAALGDIPGLASALVLVPYYLRPSESGVVKHFRRVAAVSPVPLVVYHIPYRTGRPLTAATLLELAEIPNVAGIKHAVGGVDGDTVHMMSNKPDGFDVLVGDDLYLLPMVSLGAVGGIMAAAHFLLPAFVAIVDAARGGNLPLAQDLSAAIVALVDALFAEPNPSVIKGLLKHLGDIDTSETRLPIEAASPAAITVAIQAYELAAERTQKLLAR